MNERDKLENEERERMERGEIGRTADGDELVERGTADSAISRDPKDERKP
jgi:hypothetical protein